MLNKNQIESFIDSFYPKHNPKLIDGFEQALIGFAPGPNGLVAIYSELLCIEILSKTMEKEDAYEYLDLTLKKQVESMGYQRPMILEDIGFPRVGIPDGYFLD
jgi:hypothetical protein